MDAPVNRNSLTLLVRLCHHRWAIPILAELHRAGGGSKFITLTFRLHVSKGMLSTTLARLIDFGWIERNPGYGHPMRPEYNLTRTGRSLAPWCARVHRTLRRTGAEDALLRKWSLPITHALARGCTRFKELRNALPAVTSRALTLTLKELERADVVTRAVYEEYPPRVEYQLAPRGWRIIRNVGTLPA